MSEEKDNVVSIHGGDLPADQVLRLASESGYTSVVVAGWTENDEFQVASTFGGVPQVIYTLARAQHEMMNATRKTKNV